MTNNDRTRLNLYQKLDQILGTEEANTLMEHLPPVTWNEVVTKRDLAESTGALRSEIEASGSQLRLEFHTAMAELRTEAQVGFANIRTEMISGFNRQIKWLVTFGMAWSSLLIAVMRFST